MQELFPGQHWQSLQRLVVAAKLGDELAKGCRPNIFTLNESYPLKMLGFAKQRQVALAFFSQFDARLLVLDKPHDVFSMHDPDRCGNERGGPEKLHTVQHKGPERR